MTAIKQHSTAHSPADSGIFLPAHVTAEGGGKFWSDPLGWIDLRTAQMVFRQRPKSAWRHTAFTVVARWTPLVMVGVIGLAAAGIGLTVVATSAAAMASVQAIAAAIAVRGVNEPVSRLVGRSRPFEQGFYKPIVPHAGGQAFPSNHAAGAFALAVPMLAVPGYGCVLVGLATILALSRVYGGLHYVSDVIAGALHGIFIAVLVVYVSGCWR